MTPQELKNSILQLAIQGKLVEQRAEEGTGAELLEKIFAAKNAEDAKRVEKKSHAKSAKSAKVGSCVSREEIPDDEKPFEIPESWEWVRLGEVGSLTRGSGIKRTETRESGYPCIRYGELYTTYKIRFSITKSFVDEPLYDNSKKISNGDIVMTLTGENKTDIATAVVYEGQDEIAMGGDMTCWSHHGMESLYLVYLMNSPYAIGCKRKLATGDIIVHISNEKLSSILLPLPPLAEQKRIVAKIEELLPLVERYEKAWSKLKDFNKRFPADMQKSLLQMAIQGKLVEQRAEEGTGRELLEEILVAKNAEGAKKNLTRRRRARGEKETSALSASPREKIPDAEKLFDIPETWEWARFGHIMINRDAERIPLSVDERSKLAKKYDYYGASGVIDKVDDFIFDRPLLLIGEDGANLLTRNTPIAFIARGKYWVNNHAHVLDCNSDLVHMEYVMWFINAINLAPYVTGTAQPKMNQQKMNSIPIPLPPFAEQKRIVAKLEELLPLCERLKSESNSAANS